jgi:SEC-C motif domain protein
VTCECGLGPSTEECCGRYIQGGQKAPTPEALMRSRYTAYVIGAIEHVVATHEPSTRHEIDEKGAREWSKSADWQGLEVHEVVGGADDEEGQVEFTARYAMQGRAVAHRERATFKKIGGTWFYVDGDMVKPPPVVREGPKVGRNDPCPCGSGKKHKKCCGA